MFSVPLLRSRIPFSPRTMSTLPSSDIPIFTTIASYREWRRKARDDKKSVGFVPTMGALHEGHLSLVKRSLEANDLTVLSIFVNPAQFAPHEDLSTYPRTLTQDMEKLNALSWSGKTAAAVFLPGVKDMYPSGIVQEVDKQRGTFVEVKGYGHQMEGKSRPTFFRGVATVVMKLFNVIEPTNAYFGQKDIQQALLLRRMCSDLLLSHPEPDCLHIVPTMRDVDGRLALSSRNAYLTEQERVVADTLYRALESATKSWEAGLTKSQSILRATQDVVEKTQGEVEGKVEMRLDYLQINDASSFEIIGDEVTKDTVSGPLIFSGALWLGKTRLIDNIVLGNLAEVSYA